MSTLHKYEEDLNKSQEISEDINLMVDTDIDGQQWNNLNHDLDDYVNQDEIEN